MTVVTGRLVSGRLSEGASMSNTIQTVTPAEILREQIVEDAVHSGEMEGLYIDPATRADTAEYVAGRIDSDELVARTRARYGLG
jgi:hypothetical protein